MANLCPKAIENNEDFMMHNIGKLVDEECPIGCKGPVRLPLSILGITLPKYFDTIECSNPSLPRKAGDLPIN